MAMASLTKLREYANKVKDKDGEVPAASDAGEDLYAVRLDRSLQSLQKQVKEHEAALEKVIDQKM